MSTTGQMLSDDQVAKRFPGRGKNGCVHKSTIIRLMTTGAKGADGVRRRLKGSRIGARWYTTERDLAEFLELQGRLPDDEAPAITASQRQAITKRDTARLGELLAK